jgi:hypothetical protein
VPDYKFRLFLFAVFPETVVKDSAHGFTSKPLEGCRKPLDALCKSDRLHCGYVIRDFSGKTQPFDA